MHSYQVIFGLFEKELTAMPKTHIYSSSLKVVKTLEYLHNLPEPQQGEISVKVRITDVADYLTKECADGTEAITRETAKDILNAISDSDTGYLLECSMSKGGQNEYWYRRPFTLEQVSMLSTIITSSLFLSDQQIRDLLKQLSDLTSKDNAQELSYAEHFLKPRMVNDKALDNLRIIHEAINNKKALRFFTGGIDADKNIYYDKPVRGKTKEYKRVILQDQTNSKTLLKSYSKQGTPIICYPYALAWDNSRCYLICGIDKDGHISLWNYRVDRMFELKLYDKVEYRLPKSSPYYKNGTIDAEQYLHSVFKMFTSDKPLSTITLQFKKKFTKVIVEKFGFDVSVESIDDNYAKVNVKVQISQQFYGWLTGFKADDLRMIEPESEVNEFLEYLKHNIELYQTSV